MIHLIKCLWTAVLVVFMLCLGMIAADKEMLYHHVIMVDIPCDESESRGYEEVIALLQRELHDANGQYMFLHSAFLTEVAKDGKLSEHPDELWYGAKWCVGGGDLPPGIYRVLRIGAEEVQTSRYILKTDGNEAVCTAFEAQSFDRDMNDIQFFFLSCVGYLEKLCMI